MPNQFFSYTTKEKTKFSTFFFFLLFKIYFPIPPVQMPQPSVS